MDWAPNIYHVLWGFNGEQNILKVFFMECYILERERGINQLLIAGAYLHLKAQDFCLILNEELHDSGFF